MRRFPAELADLLSPRGLRVLAGRDRAICGALGHPLRPFVTQKGLLDSTRAKAALALLDRAMWPVLVDLSTPIPPAAIAEMSRNYGELLPKTARVKTAYLDRKRARSYRVAEEIGLVAMLQSESFATFAAAIAGRAVQRRNGVQVLCYGPGDYAGPHNDHHPEERTARDGYLDVHISLANGAVAHQWLVYEEAGHLSKIESVATMGGVTAYRLPFWHYTTPLAAKAGREDEARRWLLLGTYLWAVKEAGSVRPPQAR